MVFSQKIGVLTNVVISVIALGVSIAATNTQAQSPGSSQSASNLGTAQDCTQIQVDYADDPTLTDAEKLALMDKALFKSLSRFDACANQTSNASSNSGGGGGGGGMGGGASGSGGAEGNSGESNSSASDMQGSSTSATASSNRTGSSVASSDMSGTEPSQEMSDEEGTHEQAADMEIQDGSWQEDGAVADNGKIPEDIPPADNDSVLEAQIRQAAMNETDPEIKAKLWDEYRRYKGIPTTK